MKIPFYYKLLFTILLLGCISSCVSKKEYHKLLQSVEDLKKNGTTPNLKDSDGDGVLDFLDKDPDTESDCPVDTWGIALDSDHDGHIDCKDREPYSPPGYQTDNYGVAQVPSSNQLTEENVKRIIDAHSASKPSLVLGSKPVTMTNELDELTFPEFDIPAPHFSKMENYPVREKFPNAQTLGDVDKELSAHLIKAGFMDDSEQIRFSYYQVKQDGKFKGYAVVTDFEKINASGKPLSDRFNLTVNKKTSKSFLDYIFPTSLNKGYFRCFAFLVTGEDFAVFQGQPMSRNAVAEALENKALGLKPIMAEQYLTPSSKFHVLVYEFEQLESEKDGAPATLGKLPVKTHLEGAGIWKLFKIN